MALQFSDNVRNARLDTIESTIGTSPLLRFFTGSPPANCAAAATGTTLATLTLPSDWLNNAATGSKTLLGTWSGTASAAGTAGYYRILNNAGTVTHEQGTVGAQVQLTTNALTAANGNVLNFAATTGVVTGMNVSGTGIPAGTTVVATTGTTVTLSNTSTAGVANSTNITFTYDLTLDNPVLANGQTITISTKTYNEANA